MTASSRHPRIWAIIPAAGLSRRMGRPKQTLPFGDSSLLSAVVTGVLEAEIAGVEVVTHSNLREQLRLPRDDRVHVAINDNAETEMIDSIRIGLTALDRLRPREPDGVLVIPADMPGIEAGTITQCIAAFVSNPCRIVIAAYRGERGHPIIFPYSLRTVVDSLTGGLRELPARYADRVDVVNTLDPNVTRDVDTPGDYEALKT